MQREEETAVYDFISHVFRNLKRSRTDVRENPRKNRTVEIKGRNQFKYQRVVPRGKWSSRSNHKMKTDNTHW